MRILELTNYTSGGCGVGMRVLNESRLLSERGHEVTIFSTNRVKGKVDTCPLEEKQGNVRIRRFPAKKLGGESYMHFYFEAEAINFKPDVIIAHAYRHQHTTQALKIAKKLGCKVFLVTHAPFGRKNSRNFLSNISVEFYDFFIGKKALKKFDKIITITRWENNYLKSLGVKENKIVYIPNGIDKEFFTPLNKNKIGRYMRVVYLGRIAPIKQLDTLIAAVSNIEDVECELIGPAEEIYYKKLKSLIKNSKVSINNKRYDKSEQIKILDNSNVFVLPSRTEGMPQTLVEAMARGRIVIGSDNDGNKELIKNGVNGFLFRNGDAKELSRVLTKIKSLSQKEIDSLQKNARKTAENYKWDILIQKLEKVIS